MSNFVSDAETAKKLDQFISKFRLGEFEDEVEKAVQQLNQFLARYNVAREHFAFHIMPTLAKDSQSKQFLLYLGTLVLTHAVPTLAETFVSGCVSVYFETEDNDLLDVLTKVTTKYGLAKFLSIESNGLNIRFSNEQSNFLLRVGNVQYDTQLNLLRLALDKYRELLIHDDLHLQMQELPALIQRLNNVLTMLSNFPDRGLLENYTNFAPFIYLKDVSYSTENSTVLFKSDLGSLAYDENLNRLFGLTLFPLIQPDKFKFDGSKITFVNEGKGCLSSASMQVQVNEKVVELGKIEKSIEVNGIGQVFIEDMEELEKLLRESKPNIDVKVVIRFTKFSKQFKYPIFVQTVGAWKEQMPTRAYEMALPYELPIGKLNEKEFERLCEWIVSVHTDPKFTNVRRLNEDGGGERGRDVLAEEVSSGQKYVFQCKRVDKFLPSDIEDELTTFEKYIEADPKIRPDVYVLFVSAAITDRTEERGNEIANKIGMKIEYWSRSKIDRLVRNNNEIRTRFFSLLNV